MSLNTGKTSLRSRAFRHGVTLILVHGLATIQAVEHHTVSTEVLVGVVMSTLIVALAVGELGMLTQMKRSGIAWPYERAGPVRWRDLSLVWTVVAFGVSGGSPGLVLSGREWVALIFGPAVAVGIYAVVTVIWYWQFVTSDQTAEHDPGAEPSDEAGEQ